MCKFIKNPDLLRKQYHLAMFEGIDIIEVEFNTGSRFIDCRTARDLIERESSYGEKK